MICLVDWWSTNGLGRLSVLSHPQELHAKIDPVERATQITTIKYTVFKKLLKREKKYSIFLKITYAGSSNFYLLFFKSSVVIDLSLGL